MIRDGWAAAAAYLDEEGNYSQEWYQKEFGKNK